LVKNGLDRDFMRDTGARSFPSAFDPGFLPGRTTGVIDHQENKSPRKWAWNPFSIHGKRI